MKRLFLVIVLGLGLHFLPNLKAQDYSLGIGFRAAPSYGISIKAPFGDNNAWEFIFHRKHGTRYRLSAIYQRYTSISGNWWWYGGFGGTLNYVTDDVVEEKFGIGVDAMIGIEYTADFFPISLSLDYKPGFNLFGAGQNSSFFWDEAAFSIRYLIGY